MAEGLEGLFHLAVAVKNITGSEFFFLVHFLNKEAAS